MSRFRRRTRRSDDWRSPHERARARAAQRLDWPLAAAESAWLDAHLAECGSCRSLATDYVDIRNRLRSLRTVTPPPPRDLWARTAAAIEQESRRGARRSQPASRMPLGALSGVLVIAVVLGATLLSNMPSRNQVAPVGSVAVVAGTSQGTEVAPAATRLRVAAGDVRVVLEDADGTYDFNRLGVDSVCPPSAGAECPTVRDADATALAILAQPQTIIGSPNEDRAVVVGTADGNEANEIIVMTLPTPAPSPGPSAPPVTPEPSASPVATETATPTALVTASVEPTASDLAASATPSGEVASQEPAESAVPSAEPSAEPGVEPTAELPTETPSLPPSAEPEPTPESIAIASDLIVVGQTAAFSADGRSFAFTGRPADDSTGPDIYVWEVGDTVARPVTTDHRSVFASWVDGLVVGSRPSEPAGDGVAVAPEAFVLDPATDTETTLTEPGWRPIVAPTGDLALVVDGTVTATDDGRTFEPAEGTLELRAWDPAAGTLADGAVEVLELSGSEFDARWDESGTAFAVWVQDAADPTFGRLSLYFLDSETGALEQPENAPRDEPALPGFSIGRDRLAWATPAGQGGEGSRVLIVAWTDEGVGSIETAPGERAVVVR